MAARRVEETGAPVQVCVRRHDHEAGAVESPLAWNPSVPDLDPLPETHAPREPALQLHAVTSIEDDGTLTLDGEKRVRFIGLQITDLPAALTYLRARVLRKRVFLKDEEEGSDGVAEARVILKNRISINAQLVRSGVAALTVDAAPGR
jgi:endonuclease YncB( thermonuclease family)